jgi:transcriptional regulator with XRE-family HTH domain
VSTHRDLPRDIGTFIRDLRQNAQISLRQLADQAGVSNPYLSQIERGLRKPSAEVLAQLASALRVSTPLMYLRAGLLELTDGHGVIGSIANDPDLTESQKQALTQIYETFRRENAREADISVGKDDAPDEGGGADSPLEATVSPVEHQPTKAKLSKTKAPASTRAHELKKVGKKPAAKEQ